MNMSVSLVKGQKINLSKEVAGLKKVVVGLGWDAAKQGLFGHKPNIDCDASAIILGKGNKYRGVVYYGDRSAEDGCVYHHGDNLERKRNFTTEHLRALQKFQGNDRRHRTICEMRIKSI